MELSKDHKKILSALSSRPDFSYNKLFECIKSMPKRTFHKKLYELVNENLIERNPPSSSPTPHKGKRILFKLTSEGQAIVGTQEFCQKIELEYPSLLQKVVEESIAHGKKETLSGATLFITSPQSPIYTIAHLANPEQSRKLKKFNDREMEELGEKIGHLVQAYIDANLDIQKGQRGLFFLPSKDIFFYLGFFPENRSSQIKRAKSTGCFKNEGDILSFIIQNGFLILNSIVRSKSTKDSSKAKIAVLSLRFDSEKESYVFDNQLALEEIQSMSAEEVKAKVIKLLQ